MCIRTKDVKSAGESAISEKRRKGVSDGHVLSCSIVNIPCGPWASRLSLLVFHESSTI